MNEDQHTEIVLKLATLEQKSVTLESKVDSMSNSLSDLKRGIYERVENDGKDIAVLKDQMGNVNRFMWGISGTIGLAIVAALLKMVLK